MTEAREGEPRRAETTVLYGWRDRDIESVAKELESLLGISFQPRHSLYRGDYYAWPPFPRDGGEQADLLLQENFFDEIDEELAYPRYPEHHVLLHGTGLPDPLHEEIVGTSADVLEPGN
jgi:hypothetical protein